MIATNGTHGAVRVLPGFEGGRERTRSGWWGVAVAVALTIAVAVALTLWAARTGPEVRIAHTNVAARTATAQPSDDLAARLRHPAVQAPAEDAAQPAPVHATFTRK